MATKRNPLTGDTLKTGQKAGGITTPKYTTSTATPKATPTYTAPKVTTTNTTASIAPATPVVEQERPDWIPTGGFSGGSRNVSGTGLNQAYYDEMLRRQQEAIQQRINAAVDANNAYIPQIQQQSRQALQNAYIAREQARVRTPQALNALGYTGGAAESTLLGLDTNYQNARSQIEQERSRALEGIRQNEAQIRATGNAALSEAAASYYDKLVAAALEAERQAQDQANWEAEFALRQKQYEDAAAQQAWQNAYDERVMALRYAPETQANYAQATNSNRNAAQTTPTSSGNYNTVWLNVQRALGGSNMGSQRAFDAVINYIQQSLRSGMITENEAQQMIGRLNL